MLLENQSNIIITVTRSAIHVMKLKIKQVHKSKTVSA